MVSLVLLCVSPVAHAGEPVGTDPVATLQRGSSGLGCHAQPCVPDEVVDFASWAKGGILVDPNSRGEWGVTSFGLGTTSDDGDRVGIGGHLFFDQGDQQPGEQAPDWGAHFLYDLVLGPPQGLHFYGHFEFGFLATAGDEETNRPNDVSVNIATGLGIELVKRFRKTSLRFGTELGMHWSLDAPYAVLHIGIDG